MNRSHRLQKRRVFLMALGAFLVFLSGCASTSQQQANSPDGEAQDRNVDTFEGFNRAMFRFNDTLDRWLLKPVSTGYSKVVPGPIKAGVGNFFSNIGEVPNIINDGLQWKWKQASNDTGRLLMNSTIGLLGLFDVASKAGLEKSDGEDFGQTLSVWGISRGPYVVLPLLGPNTVRGGFALPVDWVTDPVQYVDPTNTQIALNVVDTVHSRAELLSAEDLISGDRYVFVREVYLQRLQYLENDGEVEDDFGDDFGDDEYGDGF